MDGRNWDSAPVINVTLLLPFFIFAGYATAGMYAVAYLARSKLRRDVLKQLESPKTATMLSKGVQKHRSSVSRVLLELERKGFVTCLNPKDVMHRFYKITEKGRKALREFDKIEG